MSKRPSSGGARGPEPKLPRTKLEKETGQRVIVVIENASLEIVKTGLVPRHHFGMFKTLRYDNSSAAKVTTC